MLLGLEASVAPQFLREVSSPPPMGLQHPGPCGGQAWPAWGEISKKQTFFFFYLFANDSAGNICFLFSFSSFFSSLDHFYKLLQSSSLFSDN